MLTRNLLNAVNTDPFVRMSREMDRLFETMLPAVGVLTRPSQTGLFPPVNVWEDGQAYFVEAELPGYRTDDVEIFANGRELTIKGRREIDRPEGATMLRAERISGSFERVMTLPSDVDVEHVQADFRDGVLRITLPKSESARARRIAINAAPESKALTDGQ